MRVKFTCLVLVDYERDAHARHKSEAASGLCMERLGVERRWPGWTAHAYLHQMNEILGYLKIHTMG